MSVSRRMRRRARVATLQRRRVTSDRRGATLITVCITLTVLLGMVGVGVDFARAWAFKTQLKTTADAAAMAGAIEIGRKHKTAKTPEDTAGNYLGRNRLNGADTASWSDADIEAVEWNFTSRTVVTNFGNDYTPVAANGIRVTVRYAVPTTFSRVFGINTLPISTTSVAALGGTGAQNCIKPWAVSYQTVLNAYNAYRAGLGQPPVTDMNADDYATLAGLKTPVTLLRGNDDPVTPGNIAQVVTWSDSFSTKIATDVTGSPYGQAIKSQYCTDKAISIGDWVATDPGQGAGQTAGPIADLCGVQGNPNQFSCGEKAVKLVMWDQNNGLSGNNLQYRVREIAIFRVTGFDKGNGSTTPDQVTGFFDSKSESGSFSGGPCDSFSCKVALVQ